MKLTKRIPIYCDFWVLTDKKVFERLLTISKQRKIIYNIELHRVMRKSLNLMIIAILQDHATRWIFWVMDSSIQSITK